jgi:hypothetical protein
MTETSETANSSESPGSRGEKNYAANWPDACALAKCAGGERTALAPRENSRT